MCPSIQYRKYSIGSAKNTPKNNRILSTVHRKRPCLKVDFPTSKLPSPSASAIKGVIAVEKPIPKDMAINIKLFASDIAASSAVPIWPTIILSTNATMVWPNIPNITGYESFKL